MKKIALWPALLPFVPICLAHAGEALFSNVQHEARDDGPASAAGKSFGPYAYVAK